MKINFALLGLAVLMVIRPLTAPASDAIHQYTTSGTSGVFNYKVFNNRWLMRVDKEAKLAAITGLVPGTGGDIVIPSSLEGYTVYGIDEKAFASSQGVRSITIPKTIKFLRPGTLNNCQGLETIIVDPEHPDYATIEGVLFNKSKTELLCYGSGQNAHYAVPENTTAIGPYAFSSCSNLITVTIPPGVTDVGRRHGRAFLDCVNLERVVLPDTVTTIGQMTFKNCTRLKEVALPPGLTEITFGLFWNCTRLAGLTLPGGITRIGNYAFADCGNLTIQRFPATLTEIGAYAFKNCKNLAAISLPQNLVTIQRGAFRGTKLEGAKPVEMAD